MMHAPGPAGRPGHDAGRIRCPDVMSQYVTGIVEVGVQVIEEKKPPGFQV
jgi:hypothetical protein